jgi:hypothetical protein
MTLAPHRQPEWERDGVVREHMRAMPASHPGSSIRNGCGTHAPRREVVDFDLHGIIGIRLINPSAADVAAVAQHVGPWELPLSRDPEIVIRFVKHLPLPPGARWVGPGKAAYTQKSFYLVAGDKMGEIAFDQLDDQIELRCESGGHAIPLLGSLVNLAALRKDVLPLHASAFLYRGHGVVATGWPGGGKTGTMLAFMANGARYIGDDRVFVGSEGSRIFGVPGKIMIRDWHLQEIPEFRAKAAWTEWGWLRLARRIGSVSRWISVSGLGNRSRLGEVTARAARVAERHQHIYMDPRRLFGEEAFARTGKMDTVLLVVSHQDSAVLVEPVTRDEMVRRMEALQKAEWSEILGYYNRFQFAFPGARSALIEGIGDRQRALLRRALAYAQTYIVCHPSHVDADALLTAAERCFR